MAMFGMSAPLADLPKDSNVTHHNATNGDIFVFASDGVWDNLSPQDVLAVISRYMLDLGAWVDHGNGYEVSKDFGGLTESGVIGKTSNSTLQALLALAITREAKATSLNQNRDGPFAREVHKYYPGENWHGGKPDDICVVVAIALQQTRGAEKL
jgi:protein phosphatase PTC7